MTDTQENTTHSVAVSGRKQRCDIPEESELSAPSFIPRVALLTGGGDKPYALGMAEALTSAGAYLDFIGSNELDLPELHRNPQLRFFHLRGDQHANAGLARKMSRLAIYYIRLLCYAATASPRIFHVLWNNRFQVFDRTLLMLYYKVLGKKIVITAHNVNAGKRDGNDSFRNRLTLRIQYALSDHIFVHTKAMKQELTADFNVPDNKISVIPFGINNTVPNTALTTTEAKAMLGIRPDERTLLFYGNIAPYKGLEFLIAALAMLNNHDAQYRLIIAGRVKPSGSAGKLDCDQYWSELQTSIAQNNTGKQIIKRIKYIPDEETELYFKGADALVLPYTSIFQSGVLFLGYSFGLPVIATDVGSLKEQIIEGTTGFVSPAKDSKALAETIKKYFLSDLYNNLENRRLKIREYANEQYSWSKVAAITTNVYANLCQCTRDSRQS